MRHLKKSYISILFLCLILPSCQHITAACLDCIRPGAGRIYLWCYNYSERDSSTKNFDSMRAMGLNGDTSEAPSEEECQEVIDHVNANCQDECEECITSADIVQQGYEQDSLQQLLDRTVINEDSNLNNNQERKCLERAARSCCGAYPGLQGCDELP